MSHYQHANGTGRIDGEILRAGSAEHVPGVRFIHPTRPGVAAARVDQQRADRNCPTDCLVHHSFIGRLKAAAHIREHLHLRPRRPQQTELRIYAGVVSRKCTRCELINRRMQNDTTGPAETARLRSTGIPKKDNVPRVFAANSSCKNTVAWSGLF